MPQYSIFLFLDENEEDKLEVDWQSNERVDCVEYSKVTDKEGCGAANKDISRQTRSSKKRKLEDKNHEGGLETEQKRKKIKLGAMEVCRNGPEKLAGRKSENKIFHPRTRTQEPKKKIENFENKTQGQQIEGGSFVGSSPHLKSKTSTRSLKVKENLYLNLKNVKLDTAVDRNKKKTVGASKPPQPNRLKGQPKLVPFVERLKRKMNGSLSLEQGKRTENLDQSAAPGSVSHIGASFN